MSYQLTLEGEQEDIIIKNILDTARQLWPEKTAQAEQWINQQLMSYGISYAKYQAQQAAAAVQPWLQSPIVWAVGAYVFFKVFK